MGDYKNIGFKVPEDLHYKLKLMSAKTRKSITEIVVPEIRKIIKTWEEDEASKEENK